MCRWRARGGGWEPRWSGRAWILLGGRSSVSRSVGQSVSRSLCVVGCGLLIVVLGLLTTTRWALRTATATAARLCGEEPPPEESPPVQRRAEQSLPLPAGGTVR